MKKPKNLKAGDMFRVIEAFNRFDKGEIITLELDDGTENPYFWNVDKSDYHSIYFSQLEPYKKTAQRQKEIMKDYTKQAIFALLAYQVLLTIAVLMINNYRSHPVQEVSKIPCSSNTNKNCEIYVLPCSSSINENCEIYISK